MTRERHAFEVMKHALAIKAAHQLSYWDSAIVAAACAQGCREIWSEDMGHGRQLEGLRITDPFRSGGTAPHR